MNHPLKLKLRENIKKYFPKIKYSFAYGSAVIPQKDNKGKMIDVFFIVEDLKEFHKENFKMNRDHYSIFAKMSNLNIIEKVNRFGTGVYYNPTVKLNEELLIKYGVISEEDFVCHMKNWDNLFIAGRFHKPVLEINEGIDKNLEELIKNNRIAAFSLCVLKNNSKINKLDFFIDLANLSYIGDFRTHMKAEKKDKIKNVVLGAFDQYLDLYSPLIEKYSDNNSHKDYFIFNPKDNLEHVKNIPYPFLNSLNLNKEKLANDLDSDKRKIIIENHLKNINLKYSLYGILSGLYSTDLHKSFSYVLDKYKKSLNFK